MIQRLICTFVVLLISSPQLFAWSWSKKKFNGTSYQNASEWEGYGLIHTFTCFKKGYDTNYDNGRKVNSKENKMSDGQCRSISTHGFLYSSDGVEKPGNRSNKPSTLGDGTPDYPLVKTYKRKSRSRSKYMCRMKRILGQEKDHYSSPCFFIYGLNGVCHNFSARLHKAGSLGAFDFSMIGVKSKKTTYKPTGKFRRFRGRLIPIYETSTTVEKYLDDKTLDIFDGGRLSRYVYGRYGTKPSFSTITRAMKGINYVEKAMGQKHTSTIEKFGIGVLSTVTSLYHNMTMCKVYYTLRCGF